MKQKWLVSVLSVLLVLSFLFSGCSVGEKEEQSEDFVIPFYTGTDVIQINDNTPSFGAIDEDTTDFVKFSEHDSLGRCGVAEGYIGPDILPTEERGSIGMIKPSGWQTVKYGLKTIHTMTMRFIKPTM